MGIPFWQKPVFWAISLLTLTAIFIPLSFYVFKDAIISLLPPSITSKIQAVKATKPGKCLILEEEYCSLAEVIDWTNPKGEVGPVIGLRLPPGVKISLLAPKDGLEIKKIKYSDGNVLKGFQAVASDPDNPTDLQFIFKGDLHFPNLINLSPKKGEIFGYAQNTGVESVGMINVAADMITNPAIKISFSPIFLSAKNPAGSWKRTNGKSITTNI